MSSAADWRAVLAEVDQAGLCANPVRLRGITLDRRTGELAEGALVVPCKDRRAAVCPSCSRLYQEDAWQLVAAGIRGGKGVSPSVVEHPQLFVTLTAPSFGPVHRAELGGSVQPCRPRRNAGLCPHGMALSCTQRHSPGDPSVGEPLCADCFDYRGAVLWNAHTPRLWARTVARLYREVSSEAELTERELRRLVRLSYVKVAEFQRRGLVHIHVVLRVDGGQGPSESPPAWLDAEVLTAALARALARAAVPVPALSGTNLCRATWGAEHATRLLIPDDQGDSRAIAAYIAKYATKTADGSAWLAHPIRSRGHIDRLALRHHVATLVRTAWSLGTKPELRHLRLREHAHTLGYPGQFSSKSVVYSTTFEALRRARSDYVDEQRGGGGQENGVDFDGEWRFAGRGYDSPEAADLARTLAETRGRRRGTAPSSISSPSTSSTS